MCAYKRFWAADSTYYYSLHIWSDTSGAFNWNSGTQDPRVGQSALNYAKAALDGTRDVTVYRKLTQVVATLEQAWRRMVYDDSGREYRWFDTRF